MTPYPPSSSDGGARHNFMDSFNDKGRVSTMLKLSWKIEPCHIPGWVMLVIRWVVTNIIYIHIFVENTVRQNMSKYELWLFNSQVGWGLFVGFFHMRLWGSRWWMLMLGDQIRLCLERRPTGLVSQVWFMASQIRLNQVSFAWTFLVLLMDFELLPEKV